MYTALKKFTLNKKKKSVNSFCKGSYIFCDYVAESLCFGHGELYTFKSENIITFVFKTEFWDLHNCQIKSTYTYFKQLRRNNLVLLEKYMILNRSYILISNLPPRYRSFLEQSQVTNIPKWTVFTMASDIVISSLKTQQFVLKRSFVGDG